MSEKSRSSIVRRGSRLARVGAVGVGGMTPIVIQ